MNAYQRVKTMLRCGLIPSNGDYPKIMTWTKSCINQFDQSTKFFNV